MSTILARFRENPIVLAASLLLLWLIFLSVDVRRESVDWAEVLAWHHSLDYALFLASFVALVVALFIRDVPGKEMSALLRFVAWGFASLGLLICLMNVATLDIWQAERNIALFAWTYYLTLPIGALYFGLGVTRWSPTAVSRWQRLGVWPLAGFLAAVVALLAMVTAAPAFFYPIVASRAFPFVQTGLMAASFLVYVWVAIRAWRDFRVEGALFGQRLCLAFSLLAAAQVLLALGRFGPMLWAVYCGAVLLALLTAVWSILSTLRANDELQVSRYFAITGSILITGFSLILAALYASLFDLRPSGFFIVTMLLIQGVINFLLLYAIVAYLERLIQRRTQAYRREQRLRADLTQMVVHDLKSPLTVVHSSISMLSSGYMGPLSAQQATVLRRAEHSNRKILEMIETLLDVERLEVDALALREREIPMAAWLRASLADWEMVAKARNVSLQIILPDDLPPIYGDMALLQRLLDNLLSNALNFTPEGESVKVTAQAEEEHMLIRVADHGPGVPESERERIFEKFAQVEGGPRRGSGLGLTFCRMVAEAHRGTIWVADNPSGGAVFSLKLPIAVSCAAAEAELQQRPLTNLFSDTRCL